MAMKPDVLMMDEPYAALDALTRRKMQDELLQLWNDIRFTLVFVTHSIEEAVILGSRILVLFHRIRGSGGAPELNSPGFGLRRSAAALRFRKLVQKNQPDALWRSRRLALDSIDQRTGRGFNAATRPGENES